MSYDDHPETMGMGGLELSTGQKFELERMLRAIDSCENLAEIKSLAKQLTTGWMSQKATINWLIRQNLGKPPSVVAYEERNKLE